MRSDRTRSRAFLNSDSWTKQKYRDQLFVKQEKGPPFFKSNSFSGHEPNNLFMNDSGTSFQNLTLVSGVDHQGDGRGFAKLDFDQDGWQDIALISTNWPRFKLFRNQLGQSKQDNDKQANQRLRIRLEGAQTNAKSSELGSNRDGIGAKIVVYYKSGRSVLKQRQVGEGNVAQNSGDIWIGFQAADPIEKVTVKWPSGVVQEVLGFSIEEVSVVRESKIDR